MFSISIYLILLPFRGFNCEAYLYSVRIFMLHSMISDLVQWPPKNYWSNEWPLYSIFYYFIYLKFLIKAITLVTLDLYFLSNYLTKGQAKKNMCVFFWYLFKYVMLRSTTCIFYSMLKICEKKQIFYDLKTYIVHALSCYT